MWDPFGLGWARAFALSFLLPACGGDTSGGDGTLVQTCSDDYQPCGGDVVGTWQFVSACFPDRSTTSPSCPGMELGATYVTVSGTVEISADGTAEARSQGGTSQSVKMPLDCLNGMTCSEYEALMKDGATNGDTDVSATCSQVGDTCRCDVSATSHGTSTFTTYVVDGSSIFITDDEGDVNVSTFCQRGDELVMASEAGGRSTYRRQ